MLYRAHTPGPPLNDFVDNLWLYDGYTTPHYKERIMPSGTIELVINLHENELRIYDAVQPDRCERFPGALISGAYRGFFVSDTAEEASIMGVHFKPGGAFPFLGATPGEIADTHLDLETLWGPSAVELREQLCAATTPLERFRLLEAALVARLFRPVEHHYAVSLALDAFEIPLSVRDVARRIGLSQRRFIQIFTAEIGMTPKLFCRVRRFQRVLAFVRQRTAVDWATLAIDCGYFDQSHLIRDFRAFSGFSPADFLRHQNDLIQRRVHIKHNHLPLIV